MLHAKLVHKVREIQSVQVTEGTWIEACVEEAWKVVWNKNYFSRKYRTLPLNYKTPPNFKPPRPQYKLNNP